MRVLVFGARGWIGQNFCNNTIHEIICATTRPNIFEECKEEIQRINPDTVISIIGRTYGPTNKTIDYLEETGRLYENMRDNYIAPIRLASICEQLNIHFIYFGTGCIYNYSDTKNIFSEDDQPNYFGSSYSIIKGYTDTEIRRFTNSLNLRIRLPITSEINDRNLIDKLISYNNIFSINNSMTVLDDIWPIIDNMINEKVTGTFNIVNPGTVNHNDILEMYRDILNNKHTWTVLPIEQQKSSRCNNELSTNKIEQYCIQHNIEFPPLNVSIQKCLMKRKPDVFIITSVINCGTNPWSYIGTRSLFSTEDRFKQTLETISSIRKYAPSNSKILLIEGSTISEIYKEQIKQVVDIFYDVSQLDETKTNCLISNAKALGDSYLLFKAIEYIKENISNCKNIFKISGRYKLNENFNRKNISDTLPTFAGSINVHNYITWLFSVPYSLINEFSIHLQYTINTAKKNSWVHLESFLPMLFPNRHIIPIIGGEGIIAVDSSFNIYKS